VPTNDTLLTCNVPLASTPIDDRVDRDPCASVPPARKSPVGYCFELKESPFAGDGSELHLPLNVTPGMSCVGDWARAAPESAAEST
jgi:hypothetical protein